MSNLFKDKPIQTKSQVKRQKKFIEKSKKVHNGKYDYSYVNYINAHTKITIICPTHGEFEQIPWNHQQGNGCPNCSEISRRKNKTLTTEEFIKKARKVHGDKYDYSKVIYKKAIEKVCIICPIHGEFYQRPNNHQNGDCCPFCYNDNKKLGIDEFIKKSNIIHKNRYDYSKVVYKDNRTKVKIICPEHGEFWQTPSSHLQGHGCPKCGDLKRIENSKYISGEYILNKPEKYNDNTNNIIYRSSYELKAFQIIEEDEDILSWEYETIIIQYKLNRKQHKYIVDLKIETNNGIKLIEIKPYSKTIKPNSNNNYELKIWNQNQAKWKAAKEYCKEKGWEFEIWTENELGL